MHAMKVGFIAGLMVMALAGTAHGSAPVSVVTDQPGDANGLANNTGPVTTELSSPASYAPGDVIDVTLARAGDAVKVHFGLSGAPDPAGPPALYTLNVVIGTCEAKLIVSGGRVDPTSAGGFFGFVDLSACGDGLESAGVTATTDGAALVLNVPFSTLANAGVAVEPGTMITSASATTEFGVYTVSSETGQGDPVGVLIDRGVGGVEWTIPEAEPGS